MVKVGQKAPDFTAPGYQKGKFINVTLSENLGKWVRLCAHPCIRLQGECLNQLKA